MFKKTKPIKLGMCGKHDTVIKQEKHFSFHLPLCNYSIYYTYLLFLLVFLSFSKCCSYSSNRDNKEAALISMTSAVYCLIWHALPSADYMKMSCLGGMI